MRLAALAATAGLLVVLAPPPRAAEPRTNPFDDPRLRGALQSSGVKLPDWRAVKDADLGCKVLVPTSWVAGKDFVLERAPAFTPPGGMGSCGTTGGSGKAGGLATAGAVRGSAAWRPTTGTGTAQASQHHELRTSFYPEGKAGCSIRRTRTDRPFTDEERAEFRWVGKSLRASR
jgi:hypothetical protein